MAPLAFALEDKWFAQGTLRVAGIDEVGRGPLAGPVVAAAVVVPESARGRLLKFVDDSKKLDAGRREMAALAVRELCEVSLGVASVAEIDDINILQATFVAMRRAVEGLPQGAVGGVLVDGRDVPKGLVGEALIGGDGKELCIACASVVAKVWRDNLMRELHETFPGYGWATNAGYGTAAHLAGMARLGVTEHHRRSFAPVRAMLERGVAA